MRSDLHQLEQDVDRLAAKIVAAAVNGGGYAVGLDCLAHTDGGVTDIAGHQGGAVHLDQMA